MKFYGWNELVSTFNAGQDAFLKLMHSDCMITITGHVWEFGATKDETHFVVAIKPQIAVPPDHNWPKVKLHGFLSKEKESFEEKWELKIWRNRMYAGFRTHVIGKIMDYDYEKKEIHLEIIDDFNFSELEEIPDGMQIKDPIIRAEYLKICEREKKRHDMFLKRYVELTEMNNPKCVLIDKYTGCGTPLGASSKIESVRKNLNIPREDSIYFYAYDTMAITTSGIYFKGFKKALLGSLETKFYSWPLLVANAYQADEYNNGISDLFYLEKSLMSTKMYIKGLNEDCIGSDLTKKDSIGFDIKNIELPKGLSLFVRELLKGFAGMYRNDFDIQILNVEDDIQGM